MIHKLNPITVRNVPPELAGAILEKARKLKISINKAIILLLEEHLGKKKAPEAHTDLDHLAGAWSGSQAKSFDQSLAAQRAIDPELWK